MNEKILNNLCSNYESKLFHTAIKTHELDLRKTLGFNVEIDPESSQCKFYYPKYTELGEIITIEAELSEQIRSKQMIFVS